MERLYGGVYNCKDFDKILDKGSNYAEGYILGFRRFKVDKGLELAF